MDDGGEGDYDCEKGSVENMAVLCDTKRMESVEDLQSMGVPSPGLRLQARPRRGSDDQSSKKKGTGADQGDDTSKHLRSGTELTSPQYKTIAAFDQYS